MDSPCFVDRLEILQNIYYRTFDVSKHSRMPISNDSNRSNFCCAQGAIDGAALLGLPAIPQVPRSQIHHRTRGRPGCNHRPRWSLRGRRTPARVTSSWSSSFQGDHLSNDQSIAERRDHCAGVVRFKAISLPIDLWQGTP